VAFASRQRAMRTPLMPAAHAAGISARRVLAMAPRVPCGARASPKTARADRSPSGRPVPL